MNFKTIIAAVLLAVLPCALSAQTQKDLAKERKQIEKYSEQELNSRATKSARKEAKRLKKEGWVVSPGALPMDKQLDRAYKMQYEYDDNNYPKYIMAEAQSIGQNYDAAKLQALELAKQNLAGQIESDMAALIDNDVDNRQLSADEAASIVKTLSASTDVIKQKLGRVMPVMECYRTLRNGNKEVLVRIAYNSDAAKRMAIDNIKKELADESGKLRERLNALIEQE